MGNQFICEHGHAYYDGDQGGGDPNADGFHDGRFHEHDDGVASWDEWEREAYETGFSKGVAVKALP